MGRAGLEPATLRLKGAYSAIELAAPEARLRVGTLRRYPHSVDRHQGVERPAAPFDGEGAAASLRRIESELDGVVGALARLEDGTYGSCESCGTRLEASELQEQPLRTRCARHFLG